VPADGGWHRLTVDLPPNAFSPGGGRPATAALLYLEAEAGLANGEGFVELDDLSLLEWRAASAFPAGSWHEVDALRGSPGQTVAVELG